MSKSAEPSPPPSHNPENVPYLQKFACSLQHPLEPVADNNLEHLAGSAVPCECLACTTKVKRLTNLLQAGEMENQNSRQRWACICYEKDGETYLCCKNLYDHIEEKHFCAVCKKLSQFKASCTH